MKNERDPETGLIYQELRDEEVTQNWTRLFPHLRLIGDELFETVQQKLRQNAEIYAKFRDHEGKIRGSNGDRRGQALLSGLIECGSCGAKFVCAGKRIYCPRHPKGQCPCATGLNRDLAERLILDQVAEIILASPEWLSELENAIAQASTAIDERAPSEEMNLRLQLAEAESRRENLLRIAEDGDGDPDIKKRLAERRREIHQLRDRIQRMESRQPVANSIPTRESLATDLQNLAERLQGSEAAAGEVLRRLLGGRIVVEEVKPMGSRHGFLRGTLQVRVYDVSQAINRGTDMNDAESSPFISRVINFIETENMNVTNELRERVWQLYSEGRLTKEISSELKVNRNRITKLLEEASAARGEELLDGRTRRTSLHKKHLEPPLYQAIASSVMDQFDRGELYTTISSSLDIDMVTVRKAVNWWHETQGLAAPDGRSRRLQLEVKSRK